MRRSVPCLAAMLLFSTAYASELSLGEVNAYLNTSAKLGEGSKANQVAVIPFSHIDGPKNEDLFYAFVPFKYVARNYIKYQVTFISCTCRSADVNVWSTAYVELTLPESGYYLDGLAFAGWEIDGTAYQPGDTVVVSGDTVVNATWVEAGDEGALEYGEEQVEPVEVLAGLAEEEGGVK